MVVLPQAFGTGQRPRSPALCEAAQPIQCKSVRFSENKQYSAQRCAATTLVREDKLSPNLAERDAASNQLIRQGHFEADLVDRQVYPPCNEPFAVLAWKHYASSYPAW